MSSRQPDTADDRQTAIFSVDVEDWFHILALDSTPDLGLWEQYPSRVERNFRDMLATFREAGVTVTCFFLGWVAERYPHLVREAAEDGHEIASHGYSHTLTYELGPERFSEDVKRAKDILENILGEQVIGYRTPGFSVTERTPWFFENLAEAGYTYDSSVFPANRQHGGLRSASFAPYQVRTPAGTITELPITVAKVLGRPMCFSGGGYLRLFPYPVIKRLGRSVMRDGRPLIFYVHPREIDLDSPRLEMGPVRRFKSYVGLRTTRAKMRAILDDFRVTTFAHYLSQNPIEDPS